MHDAFHVLEVSDHPRSRGVYVAELEAANAALGSSPLARGLPGFHKGGATATLDHPRSRGVYSQYDNGRGAGGGSSPLARGLLPGTPGFRLAFGIIPARAGFTPSPAYRPWNWPDHPRSRGVYLKVSALPPATAGSSPLARGLRADDMAEFLMEGIIPARAGFTY